jgi:endonuclease YncB( thermonuclease family)
LISTLALCLVLSVHDGDTLTARCEGEKIHVRLVEIDAPEYNQPYGQVARRELKALCVGETARIASTGKDRYGRTLGRVTCRGVDANRALVRDGLAWVYDQYVTDRSLYADQDDARAAHRGLWSHPGAVPPWVWRHPALTPAPPPQ